MENKWVIYDKFGAERATVKELEYHGEWMGDEFITVTVKSPVPVEFQYGDYLVYRNSNEKYYIDYNTNKIHRASKESYGEAFVYENVKMYHESHVLKDVMFKDYVLNDNGMAYSQQAKFSFFAGSVEDLADRIQANLNKALGSNTWKVITPVWSRTHARNNITKAKWLGYYSTSAVSGITDVNISCDGISCKDALRLVYDQFGLSYVIIGNNIVISGDKGIDLSNTLEYGKGKGLFELEKNTDESQQVVTKMYAYGSSENMPLNYYANIGKTAKAAIACVSKREYIKDNPQLLLWVAKPWTEVKSAFGSNMSVTLQYKNLKVQANVRYDTYTFGKEKNDNDHALDHETEYLYFWMRQLDVEGALAFYEAVEQAGEPNNWPVTIAINSGANVNALPDNMVEHSTNYPALLSIQNLMLPGFPDQSLHDWVSENRPALLTKYRFSGWDITEQSTDDEKRIAKLSPWIESLKADTIGEREGAVYFDGSNTDVENIHPTIEGTTAALVTASSNLSDNGYLAEGTDLSFRINVKDGILNWYDAWSNADEDVYINMKTGYCTGRAFKMLSKPKKNGNWELVLERAYDSSLQRYFPYQDTATDGMSNYAQICVNDKFVVTGIQLPKSYVDTASIKLLEAALEALDEMDHPKETYIPKIDEIEAARERDTKSAGTSLYDTIHAGLRLKFKDTADGADSENAPIVTQYIDTLTIKENGNNGIPTFDVVLRDEKELTSLQKIRNQISSMSGSGTPSSSSGTSTAEDEEKPVGGACLTPLLFELHKADPLEGDTVIDPEEWESEIEADEEARASAVGDYETPLSIKSKYGHWTDYFMSALGIGSGSGGSGAVLEWPLLQINDANMPAVGDTGGPSSGDTIVYDPNVTGYFKWGKAGEGLSGLTLMDGVDVITPIGASASADEVTYNLGEKFLSLKYGGTIINDVFIARPTTISNFDNISDNLVLNFGETKRYFNDKFVTVEFFESLFKVYNGADTSGNQIRTNGTIPNPSTNVNIKAMFGFWTEQYLSALGIGSSGSGGGTPLNEPLMSINGLDANPTNQQINYTLVWKGQGQGPKGTGWVYEKAGLDETALATYLINNKYLTETTVNGYTWWGRQLVNGVVSGDINDADNIYVNKNKFISIQFNSTTQYSVLGMGSDNVFLIGWGLKDTAYNTTLASGNDLNIGYGTNTYDTYGKYWTVFRNSGHVTINTNDNTVSGRDIFLNVGGNTKTNRLYLYIDPSGNTANDVYLEYVIGQGGVHLYGAGFYADTYVSSLGVGSTGGAVTGIDWDALVHYDNDSSHRIDYHYLSQVTKTLTLKVNGTTYTYNGTADSPVIEITSGGSIATATDVNSYFTADKKAIDADKLDGKHLSELFETLKNSEASGHTDDVEVKIGGETKYLTVGYASKAGQLKTDVKLWDNTFNGTQSIGTSASNASLSYVRDITMSGNVKMNRGQFIQMKVGDDYRNVLGTDYTIDILSFGYRTAEQGLDTDIFGANTRLFYYDDTWREGLTLANDGCVGIGTSTPAYKLHVNGVSRFMNTIGQQSTVVTRGTAPTSRLVLGRGWYDKNNTPLGWMEFTSETNGDNYLSLFVLGNVTSATDAYGGLKIKKSQGATGNYAMIYDANTGQLSVTSLKIGNVVITNENNGIHVNSAGMYADTYVSSLGLGSDGTPAVFDEGQMWDALGVNTGTYQNRQIALGHLTTALSGYVKSVKYNNGTAISPDANGIVDLGTISGTGDYLPLTGGTIASAYRQLLTINQTGENAEGPYIAFKLNGTDVGYFGYNSSSGFFMQSAAANKTLRINTDGTLQFGGNRVLDAGNVAGGSNITFNWNSTTGKYEIANTYSYSLPTASSSTKGGVKVGNGLTMSGESLQVSLAATDIPTLTAAKISDLSLTNGTITIGNSTITPLTDALIKSNYMWWGQKLNAQGKVDGAMTVNSDVGELLTLKGSYVNSNSAAWNCINFQHTSATDDSWSVGMQNNTTTSDGIYDFYLWSGAMSANVVWVHGGSRNANNAGGSVSIGIRSFPTDTRLYVNGNIRTGGDNGSFIQIGQLRIVYEQSTNSLKVVSTNTNDQTANFCATGAVSALGMGSTGSVNTFDEEQMWTALGGTMQNQKIANSHLNLYSLSIITKNGTQEYNPASGSQTIDISSLTGNYLPLTGGTMSGNVIHKSSTLQRGVKPTERTVMHRSWYDKNDKPLGWFEFVSETNGRNQVGLYVLTNTDASAADEWGGLTIYKEWGATGSYSMTFNANTGLFTARKVSVSNGTSSQFMKADGSLDSNTYMTGIGNGTVTNAMLAGSIANSKLANSSITINGTSVSLGGSFSTASITAGTAGTSSATSGGSLSVPYVKMNAYGIVTAYGTHTHTIDRLSGDDAKTAWGRTFWSGGKPQTVSGDMTDVGTITFREQSVGKQFKIYDYGIIALNATTGTTAWNTGFRAYNNAGSDAIGFIGIYGTGNTVKYAYVGRTDSERWMTILPNGNTCIGNESPSSTEGDILSLSPASSSTYTAILYKRPSGYASWSVAANNSNNFYWYRWGGTLSGGTAMSLSESGSLTLGSGSGTYIKIGGLYLVYDSTNNALKVSASATGNDAANFYATGAVSALGTGSGSSGTGTDLGFSLSGTTLSVGTSQSVDLKYAFVTLSGNQDIGGNKNFTGTVTIGGNTKYALHAGNARNYAMGLQSFGSDGAVSLSGKDLNKILAAGTYCSEAGSSQSHQPYDGDYRLWHIVNTGTDNNAAQNSAQLALAPTAGRMFLRSHTSSGFGSWNEFVLTGTSQTISGGKTFTGGIIANKLQFSTSGGATVLEYGKFYAANATIAIQGTGSQNLTLCAGGGTVIIGSASAPTNVLASAKVKVQGAVATTGGCFYGSTEYDYSDIRQKDVIENIKDLNVEKIARAPLFRFTWKDGRDAIVHAGTSAQYWLSTFPEVVGGVDEDTLYLSYSTTALASAITIARTVQTHEERIKKLEAENKRLRNEIELLKAA